MIVLFVEFCLGSVISSSDEEQNIVSYMGCWISAAGSRLQVWLAAHCTKFAFKRSCHAMSSFHGERNDSGGLMINTLKIVT